MMVVPQNPFERLIGGPSGPLRRQRRRGAMTLEFAVIALFVMFPIFLGIVEVARGIMVSELLTQAARVGCRTGVVEGKSTSDIQAAVNDFLPTVGINAGTASVQVNDAAADAGTAQATDEITVIVSVPLSKVTWMPGGQYLNSNLSGQFTLRRE